MSIPRLKVSLRVLMTLVATIAVGLAVLKAYLERPRPTPESRALELANSVPTASYYEATAIYQAALFHEEITPGSLTKLARLPKVQVREIKDGRPLPLSWSVVFTDPKSGKKLRAQTFFSLSTVNGFRHAIEDAVPSVATPLRRGRGPARSR